VSAETLAKLLRPGLKAVLTDIEGTIGDISFVRNVLFPYARERLRRFMRERGGEAEVARLADEVRREAGLSAGADVVPTLESWIDADKKATPLKALQGMIWREGYESGVLKAHLYDDVVPAFRKWRAAGLSLWSYSSGSVEAQELYYRYSIAGDILPMFSGCFDTRIGAKGEAASYAKIAERIGVAPETIIFFSDARAEIAAATQAGLRAVRIDRSVSTDSIESETSGGVVAGSFAHFLALAAR
jgi:enolase-phosphatase E1